MEEEQLLERQARVQRDVKEPQFFIWDVLRVFVDLVWAWFTSLTDVFLRKCAKV